MKIYNWQFLRKSYTNDLNNKTRYIKAHIYIYIYMRFSMTFATENWRN